MAKLTIEQRVGNTHGGTPYTVIAPVGLITTDTSPLVDAAIAKQAETPGLKVLVDFGKVTYVNSTGLGQLITHLDTLTQAGGDMVLANLIPEVKRVIRLLGIDKILKVVPSEAAASRYFDDGNSAVFEEAFKDLASPLARKKRKKLPPTKTSFPLRSTEAKVIYASQDKDVFADILEMRWGSNGGSGQFRFATNAKEIERAVQNDSPDLLILDHRMDDGAQICEAMKRTKASSLISIIRLYANHRGADPGEGFYVRENEFVSEPFEINELIALAEAELVRTATERKTFVHQIQFQFQNAESDLDRGIDFIAQLIRQSGVDEREAGELRTAVREAVDNAYRHGNKSQPARKIYVNYVLDQDKVVITVEDEGEGFDSNYYLTLGRESDAAERARKQHESGKTGGLGIMLMMKCLDTLEYNPVGNLAKLTKSVR